MEEQIRDPNVFGSWERYAVMHTATIIRVQFFEAIRLAALTSAGPAVFFARSLVLGGTIRLGALEFQYVSTKGTGQ